MQGRLHGYEGNTAQQVAFPVWLMHRIGIGSLITTNAAGAINPAYRVGDFCIMRDHINLTGRNPLVGVQPDQLAERFVPMLNAYDPSLIAAATAAAKRACIPVQTGVYLGLLGPSFETPAEIRAFATMGADTVAMSVVEEVIAARHCGMRTFGMSLVSNMACGVEGGDPQSDDIMGVARSREDDFAVIIDAVVDELAR
jgi:purine-nucleoside phosphorylase